MRFIKLKMNGRWIYSYTLSVLLMVGSTFAEEKLGPHDWTDSEKTILRSLWLGGIDENEADLTNRVATNPDAAKLGQQLFFDTRFSANGKIACVSCHDPKKHFTDGRATAMGLEELDRNAPSIVGISHSHWFFHDGRTDSLWSQALVPLENEKEHGGNRGQYAHIIYNDKELSAAYEKPFGKLPDLKNTSRFPISAGPVKDAKARAAWGKMKQEDRLAITQVFVNMGKALAAYERLLQPSASKFDRYIEATLGKDRNRQSQIFSDQEAQGLRLFVGKANCTICHNGPLFSDFEFHNIATPPKIAGAFDFGRYKAVPKVLKSEFNCYGKYNDAQPKDCSELDYIVREKEHTLGSFRTPSLRNVTKTAPYMHAGQYDSLKKVVEHYVDTPSTKVGKSDLLDIDLTEDEINALVAFLKTLDSETNISDQYTRAP